MPPGASQASARSSSRCSAARVRVLVGVDDRDQFRRKWFDLQPTGHQARKAPDGPGRRGRGGSTNAWRPARRAATNLEGRVWRDLDGPSAAPTSRSSGQLRSWSARVRAGVARPGLDIPLTLLAGSAPPAHHPGTGARGAGMKHVDLHHGASTDVGLVRKVNEDSFLVAPPVFVVADGMGGHSGGDVASQMVVEEFQRLAEAYDPRSRRRARRRRLRPRAGADRRLRRRPPGDARPAGTPAPPPSWPSSSTTTASPSGCWPTSATPASTASPRAGSSRSASTTRSSRS